MEEMSSQDRVFESAAELFAVLDTPVRLKIISAVCQQEKNVTELLALIDTTQPNMSQHLATLYRSGVLSKRRVGTQIYYRLQSERVAMLCRGGVFGSAGAPGASMSSGHSLPARRAELLSCGLACAGEVSDWPLRSPIVANPTLAIKDAIA